MPCCNLAVARFMPQSWHDVPSVCSDEYMGILQVDFDTELDLGPFMSNRRGPAQPYSLYGVLVHSGHSVHSGHYYAFVKAPNGLWHQLDDNHVSQVTCTAFCETNVWVCYTAYALHKLYSRVAVKRQQKQTTWACNHQHCALLLALLHGLGLLGKCRFIAS